VPAQERGTRLSAFRRVSQWIVSSFVLLLAAIVATTGVVNAETWQWQYLAHIANSEPLKAQATVAVSQNEITTSYTATIRNRQTVISSCRAALADVEKATAVRTEGQVFFLVQLKPRRAAECSSGREPVAALPGDDFNAVSRVADLVNRSVVRAAPSATPRRVAAAPPPPSPKPKPRVAAVTPSTPAPTPTPTPTPSPTPRAATPAPTPSPTQRAASPSPVASSRIALATQRIRVIDWVENEGLFMFVRVHNIGPQPVTIGEGQVWNCKNVDVGCGKIGSGTTVAPHDTVTIATIASTDQRATPSFTYHYAASTGTNVVVHDNTSLKKRPVRYPPMSGQDVRAAEAVALGGLRSPGPGQQAPTLTPPRLIKRGSSRLAIGQHGTALVRVLVAANGTPQEATIVSITNRQLSAAAIETAVSSQFTPATKNGQPVAGNYVATFSFDGEDPDLSTVPVWRRVPMPASSSPSPSASPSSSPSPTPR
jgi:outer membrane biosynthesis protein TonB